MRRVVIQKGGIWDADTGDYMPNIVKYKLKAVEDMVIAEIEYHPYLIGTNEINTIATYKIKVLVVPNFIIMDCD